MPTPEQMQEQIMSEHGKQSDSEALRQMFGANPIQEQQPYDFRDFFPSEPQGAPYNRVPEWEPRPAPRPMLHVMCGLPRSGKSTHARIMGHPIVSPDAIRLALHGQRFLASAEPFVWAIAQTMVKALFEAGHKDVIVDACNVTEERRKMWRSVDWQVEFIHVSTPAEVCLERADREGDKEIMPVIERMARQWEPFTSNLEFYEVKTD